MEGAVRPYSLDTTSYWCHRIGFILSTPVCRLLDVHVVPLPPVHGLLPLVPDSLILVTSDAHNMHRLQLLVVDGQALLY